MILTIISTLLGFFSSTLPSIFKYLEEKQKLKYNVQIVSLQLEATLRNIDAVKEIEKIKASIQDTDSAREHDNNTNGGSIINFIRATVRPFVTYSFVALYISVKLIILYALWNEGFTINNLEAATKIILDETTVAMIAMILGFWFGQRAMLNKDR